MRQIRFAVMALGLALVLVACGARVEQSAPPTASETPSSTAPSPTLWPAPTSSPGISSSPSGDAAQAVLDAALATQAAGTLSYTVDVRSADPDDPNPPVTGTGQVSFSVPIQFRFARPGVPGTVPASEEIFDGSRLFVRGDDSRLPADTWLMLETSSFGRDMVMRQEADSLLVLVTPLGVTSAERAGEETIGMRAVTRYVTQVDIAAAGSQLAESLVPAYEARLSALQAAGVPLTHEVEIWVDADGHIARTRYIQEVQGQNVAALVITYDFEGYGVPMDAAPPPGDEVLTLDEARERYPGNPSPS